MSLQDLTPKPRPDPEADDGLTFQLKPGVRLRPQDFAGLKFRTLHDPWPILLPDGRVRLYLHGFIDEGEGRNAIVSATSQE